MCVASSDFHTTFDTWNLKTDRIDYRCHITYNANTKASSLTTLGVKFNSEQESSFII